MTIPPNVAPIGATPSPQQTLDAFAEHAQNAAGGAVAAGQAAYADPNAVARATLAALERFEARSEQVQTATRNFANGTAPSGAPGSDAANPTPAPQRLAAMMLETYDFAIETEMVTRAATTFTSSVNTLIKTQ